jgi:hypothetical protein
MRKIYQSLKDWTNWVIVFYSTSTLVSFWRYGNSTIDMYLLSFLSISIFLIKINYEKYRYLLMIIWVLFVAFYSHEFLYKRIVYDITH